MNILYAVILGIIQGLTEFLPVSSSGHLVLFQNLFGLDMPGMQFDVVLHIGTLIPVIIVFRKDIIMLIKKPFQKYVLLLAAATIPAVIFALLLGDAVDELFKSGAYLGLGFILTGLVLIYADRIGNGKKKEEDITLTDSIVIGTMQAIAICPAISRSGSTIGAALFRKLDRETAARFSFLLSIPAILGAAVLAFKDVVTGGVPVPSADIPGFVAGFIASGLTGYLAITFMLKIIKKGKLRYFAYYVFALAALILADKFIFGLVF